MQARDGRRGNVFSARLILDLCGGSGAWAAPYTAAGYTVVRVELSEGCDVHTLEVSSFVGEVWGLLAAPPCTEFSLGDPWTKRTAIWGKFKIPERGPFVTPTGSAMDRRGAAARAVTPPGFARAFFEANP